jgi:hypothetical protein
VRLTLVLAVLRIALLAVIALPSAAAPFAVPLGPDRVVLDTPPGFADTVPLGSPRLEELAQTLTSASNKILLFGITDGDLRRFTNGERPDLKRYLIAVTPLRLEREQVSVQEFERVVQDALRGLGSPPREANVVKYLDSQPPGQSSLLAELRRDAGVVTVLQGARLDAGGRSEKPLYLLSTTTLLRVRGKALNLAVYSAYESPADLEWIRFTTGRWVEDLERLNRQNFQ